MAFDAVSIKDDDTKMSFMKIAEKIIDICQYRSKIMLIGEKKPLIFSEIIDSLRDIILKIFDTHPKKFTEYYCCMLKQIWYSYLNDDSKETDTITKIAIFVSYYKVMQKFSWHMSEFRRTIKNNTKSMKINQMNMIKTWKYLIVKQNTFLLTFENIKGTTKEIIDYYS